MLSPLVYTKRGGEVPDYKERTLLRAVTLKNRLKADALMLIEGSSTKRFSLGSAPGGDSRGEGSAPGEGWNLSGMRGKLKQPAGNNNIPAQMWQDALRILVPSTSDASAGKSTRRSSKRVVVSCGLRERFAPLAAFYRIPAVQLVTRALVHAVGVVLHCALVLTFTSTGRLEEMKGEEPSLPTVEYQAQQRNPIEFIWWSYEVSN